ncbi:MAG TPA: FtsQ-type POTRA domain-containing protein [Anaerolineae bacterium]|nr:FtsQ-type POTRA domain-containing protein [Anaerolineae bacterium]
MKSEPMRIGQRLAKSNRPPSPRYPRRRQQPKRRQLDNVDPTAMPQVILTEAAKRRRRQQQNQQLQAWLGTGQNLLLSTRWLSLAILLICLYTILQISIDERFYLTQIPVDGLATIPPGEIMAATGIAGKHIFAIDPNQVAADIAQVPGVVSSAVTLSWPNQVQVSIVEDSPIAIWEQDGTDFWINKQGAIFPARGLQVPGLLRIISELPPPPLPEPPPNADPNEPAEPSWEDTLPLAFVPQDVLDGAFLLRELRPELNELYYRSADGLSFVDERGRRIYMGTGLDMNQKLAIYEAIRADLVSRNLTFSYISVSNQAKPYYR